MSAPDYTPPAPIEVHATPTKPQIEAGIRQLALVLSGIFTTLGLTVWAGKLGYVVTLAPQLAELITIVGPMVIVAVGWLGQIITRRQAKQIASLVPLVPDETARFK